MNEYINYILISINYDMNKEKMTKKHKEINT